MSAVSKIRRVLDPNVRKAHLMIESMIIVPSTGATSELIARLNQELPRPLSEAHRAVLSVWNGIDLDVIRILGVPPTENGIAPIMSCQKLIPTELVHNGAIAFASDPSGFVYFEARDGSVTSWDHDGGATEHIAATIDDFIDHVVFGDRAAEFAGEQWLQELKLLGFA